MTSFDTQGWLPLDFLFDPEPALVTTAIVRWMDFEGDPLIEPFFWNTVEKIRKTSSTQQIDTSTETLFRVASLLPAARPAGFIFHVSHCGSTLVANALRAAPRVLVGAEATPFVRLALWRPEAADSYLRTRWHATLRRLFDSLFTIYANYMAPEEPHRLVLKFSSINLFGLKFVRQCCPEIPCVVLVRDPVEVLVSSLGESGWLAHKLEPGRPQELYGWTDAPCAFRDMPDEEYCARLLGRHLRAALDGLDAGCQIIDYEDLNRRRISEIAHFFGLDLPQDEPLRDAFTVYSKDPRRAIRFQDDRQRKRLLASKALHAAAQEFAMQSYIELRSRSAW